MDQDIEIRECTTIEEFSACVQVQRDVFALPEGEISPVRHFVVTKNAGGFTLGAFSAGRLAGFVLSVPAFLRGEPAYYSHMTGVLPAFQSLGIGARLKWAQRDRALSEGVEYIKWTFEPVKARNAYFNLEKLGAVAAEIKPNFYGTDYATNERAVLASDRLFAEWALTGPKVEAVSQGRELRENRSPAAAIVIMADWAALLQSDVERALSEQRRIRTEFEAAFSRGLVAREFVRGGDGVLPKFLLFED